LSMGAQASIWAHTQPMGTTWTTKRLISIRTVMAKLATGNLPMRLVARLFCRPPSLTAHRRSLSAYISCTGCCGLVSDYATPTRTRTQPRASYLVAWATTHACVTCPSLELPQINHSYFAQSILRCRQVRSQRQTPHPHLVTKCGNHLQQPTVDCSSSLVLSHGPNRQVSV
jgi:hypothetical protein